MRVLKIGGGEVCNHEFMAKFCRSLSDKTESPIIINGGGQKISSWQSRIGIPVRKVSGLRITNEETMEIAEMILSGSLNKLVVRYLLSHQIDAIGISGVDGGLLRCRSKTHSSTSLGMVGTIIKVRRELLDKIVSTGLAVVISPVSLGIDGQPYNVNADEAASAIAASLKAPTLDYICSVPGILNGSEVIRELDIMEAKKFIKSGLIHGGMIPKVQSALEAINNGAHQVRIGNLQSLHDDKCTVFRPI